MIVPVSVIFGYILIVGASGVGVDLMHVPEKRQGQETDQEVSDNARLLFTGVSEDSPRLITWNVSALPQVQYKEMVVSGVTEGFEAWERLNPELDFERIEGNADIDIEWEVEPAPYHVGLAEYTYLYSGTITIHLGDYDCKGRYNQWDQAAITNITMHEIGHILGLEHVSDQSHLMYGDVRSAPEDFQTLGYNVPDSLENHFVGEAQVHDDIEVLEARLAGLDKEYTEIIKSRGMAVEDYESGRAPISSRSFDGSIAPVIDEYNKAVYEYNILVDTLNCYYKQ